MANTHIDGLGIIDWSRGITHGDLVDAGLLAERLRTQMQLEAHPSSVDIANAQRSARAESGDSEPLKFVRIPLREIIYATPVSVARTVGGAIFAVLSGGEHAHYEELGWYPSVPSLSVEGLETGKLITPRIARQIRLADLGVQPQDAKAAIHTQDGTVQTFIRTPLAEDRIYESALDLAMDTAMATQAILTGQEIYQASTVPAVRVEIG